MLEVRNVYASPYGGPLILQDISLKVDNEEFVTIIGPNGAGKTTLLYVISGVYHPVSGSITWDGERIDKLKPYEIANRGISLVPEGRKIFSSLTVLENLRVGSFNKEAKKKWRENLQKVFDFFPILEERKNQIAGTLSGGEQQMLAIGRALMANPKLILLDEPSLGLAPMFVKKMLEVFERFKKEGISLLLVEQNVHISLRIADRAYVQESGQIRLEGRGEDLLRNEEVKRAYLGLT
jgi:branched-chain amino acid transport system ATP-binding protein